MVKNSVVQSFYNTIQYPEPLFSSEKIKNFTKTNKKDYRQTYQKFIIKNKKKFVIRHRINDHYLQPENAKISIADFGCGTGNNAIILASIFPNANIHCYDIADNSLKHLQQTINILDLKNITLFKRDLMKDKLNYSYNMIFSLGVMHHTVSIQKTFKNITSTLKKGGIGTFFLYHKNGKFYETLANKLVLTLAKNNNQKLEIIKNVGLDRKKLSAKLVNLYDILLDSSKVLSISGRIKSIGIRIINKLFRSTNLKKVTSLNANWDGFAHPLAQFIDTEDIKKTIENSNNVLVDLWFGDANRISEQSTKKLLDNLGLAEYTPKNSDQFIYAGIQEILIAPRKIYFSVSKLAKG